VASAYRPAVSLKGTAGHRGSNKWYLRKGLIVFQFAISLFFIVATLVMRDQIRFMQTKDRGFSTHAIATFRTSWNDKTARTKMLAHDIKSIPNIAGVALQSVPPMGFARMTNTFVYKGDTIIETGVSIKAGNSDFIPLYGFRFLAGRNISDSDSLKELVINDYYRKVLGFKNGEGALGAILYFNDKPYPIVGVVEDVAIAPGLDATAPLTGEETMYVPASQMEAKYLSLAHIFFQPSWIVRTARPVEGLTAQMQRALASVDPNLPFSGFYSMRDLQAKTLATQRVEVALLSAMAALALLLSAVGIFSLVANIVAQKTREIGIRIALGSTIRQAMVHIGGPGIRASVLGLLLGLIACGAALRAMRSVLYGVGVYDAPTILSVVLILASISLLASAVPTLRIAAIDPAKTLREE